MTNLVLALLNRGVTSLERSTARKQRRAARTGRILITRRFHMAWGAVISGLYLFSTIGLLIAALRMEDSTTVVQEDHHGDPATGFAYDETEFRQAA